MLLAKVEAVVNARPLTCVQDDGEGVDYNDRLPVYQTVIILKC